MSRTQSVMVELGTPAPAFELLDVVSGRVLSRDELLAASRDDGASEQPHGGKPQGLLVMFVCVHCPYVKHVEEELGRIGADYRKTIAVVAISSNDTAAYPQDGPEQMKAQSIRLGWPFPYLYDETQEVARSYNAACTPDFFLYDAELELVYRGQLDDSRPPRSAGEESTQVTGRDLRQAMDRLIAGEQPDTNQRTSLGCNIKWRETEV